MAKKIRGLKIKKSSDVNKNSGIKITHTINKIKEHEARYTAILTGIFMVLIVAVVYFSIRFENSNLSSYSKYTSYSHLSSSGRIVHIGNNDIKSDNEGLKSEPVSVSFSNMTNHTINYVIRFEKEESMIENCNCEIADYKNIRFSLDGKNVRTFDNDDMIVTTGMIKSNNDDALNVRFWFDNELDKNSDCNFYGKFVFEEFNNMELEENS